MAPVVTHDPLQPWPLQLPELLAPAVPHNHKQLLAVPYSPSRPLLASCGPLRPLTGCCPLSYGPPQPHTIYTPTALESPLRSAGPPTFSCGPLRPSRPPKVPCNLTYSLAALMRLTAKCLNLEICRWSRRVRVPGPHSFNSRFFC
jgi:hypothetical protein